MKTVLIIHGIMGHAGVHWQGWLAEELKKRGYKVIMPDMPDSKHPNRKEWLNTIQSLTKNVNLSDLTIVGHSLGVPTALDFLETVDQKIKALISISGFAENYGAELNSYFLSEKNIDFTKVNKNLDNVYVLCSDNDPYVTQKALLNLAKNLKVSPIVIENGGHFNKDSNYSKFPKLLEILFEIYDDYDIHKAGGVLLKNKKLLVSKSVNNHNFFVAPGGKLHDGETPKQALVRELKEEQRIKINQKDLDLLGSWHAVATGDARKRIVRMDVFIVKKWKGEPTPNKEFEKDIMWISSTIPKGIKISSIFEHEVIPRLKKKSLIK